MYGEVVSCALRFGWMLCEGDAKSVYLQVINKNNPSNRREVDMYKLVTESSFDAAHFLTDYHGKCENLHGHRWRVVATLATPELQKDGTCKDMVVDFGAFKAALRELTEAVDHTFIVEEGSLQPQTIACLQEEGFTLFMAPFRTTAENLAQYFFNALVEQELPVAEVAVYETPNNCAVYSCD